MVQSAAPGRRFFDRSGLPLVVLGAIVFCFLAAPIVGLAFNLSGPNLLTTYRDPQTRAALGVSLSTASVATAIVGILGIPLAYFLARFRFRGRTLVNILVFLPLVLPPVSAGILLIMLYGPYGTIGRLFDPHGIDFVDTSSGIVLAQIFVSAPYVIVTARSAFERIDPEYEEAAASMGAGIWMTFRHVALPMARGGILAGLTLGWMRSLGEFGATVILAYHPYSLPVLNYVNLNSSGLATALPLALLAFVIAGGVLVVLFFLEQVDWGTGLSRP
ncbi:MAG: ABC transporter permease [Chloroflexota bacterium]|nr:ABC transporter permease [Chloroflexota bacterium]